MPTYEWIASFAQDLKGLTEAQRTAFQTAVKHFVDDLENNDGKFRNGLRVKSVQGAPGVFEMTWAPDGRATFEYGPAVREGERHVVWRRIGTHDVFDRP